MEKGRKVLIFIVRRIKEESIPKFKKKMLLKLKNKAYVPIPPSVVLPYSAYSDKGLAEWLYFNYGAVNPTTYRISSWRGNKRSPTKTSFITLAKVRIYELENGSLGYHIINKRNISKSLAWRINREEQMARLHNR